MQKVFKLLLERGLLRLQWRQDLPRRWVLARATAGLHLRLELPVFLVEAGVVVAGGQPQAWRVRGGRQLGWRSPGRERGAPPSPRAHAPSLRTAVAVVIEVEVAVFCQALPQHQVVGDVAISLGRWLPAHQQVGGGVGRGDDVLGNGGRWGVRRVPLRSFRSLFKYCLAPVSESSPRFSQGIGGSQPPHPTTEQFCTSLSPKALDLAQLFPLHSPPTAS